MHLARATRVGGVERARGLNWAAFRTASHPTLTWIVCRTVPSLSNPGESYRLREKRKARVFI